MDTGKVAATHIIYPKYGVEVTAIIDGTVSWEIDKLATELIRWSPGRLDKVSVVSKTGQSVVSKTGQSVYLALV